MLFNRAKCEEKEEEEEEEEVKRWAPDAQQAAHARLFVKSFSDVIFVLNTSLMSLSSSNDSSVASMSSIGHAVMPLPDYLNP